MSGSQCAPDPLASAAPGLGQDDNIILSMQKERKNNDFYWTKYGRS